MNQNGDDMNIMNGWREKKTEDAYAEKNRARPHNDPGALRQLMYTEEKKKVFLIIIKLTGGQFPQLEFNSQSIKQAERKSTRGSSSTRQHQRGNLQGLTNPHILQQQHPPGGLEPCAYWSFNQATACCSLSMTLQPAFFYDRRKKKKIIMRSWFSPFSWLEMINT